MLTKPGNLNAWQSVNDRGTGTEGHCVVASYSGVGLLPVEIVLSTKWMEY